MGKIERSAVRRRVRSPAMSEVPSAEPEVACEQSVLVVEADPDQQVPMARALRKQGLRVVATGSGSGALALVSEWDVTLILVSESLPGRSGIDLVREIHRTRPASRIVMITSDSEPRFAAAARAAGALGCVAKPLTAESLSRWLADPAALAAPAALAEPTADRDISRLVPTVKARSGLARHASALPLTNSALPARGAVAE